MTAIVLAGLTSLVAGGVLLAALDRLMPRDALLSETNERSNHQRPVRQIGGLAVVPAMLVGTGAALAMTGGTELLALVVIAGATLLLVVGAIDDRTSLPVGLRLVVQLAAAGLLVAALGAHAGFVPYPVPAIVSAGLLVLAVVWMVNLTNFMDGLDLMVVAGIGVPHLVLAAGGAAGLVPPFAAFLSASLAGALIAFSTVNWPSARMFLGDGGSLAIGFLTAAVMLIVAGSNPVAAALPFLFFIADSGTTLMRRALRGERLTTAHSTHAYQVAFRAGRGSLSISGEVAILSTLNGGLCLAAIWGQSLLTDVVTTSLAVVSTSVTLFRLRGKPMAQR